MFDFTNGIFNILSAKLTASTKYEEALTLFKKEDIYDTRINKRGFGRITTNTCNELGVCGNITIKFDDKGINKIFVDPDLMEYGDEKNSSLSIYEMSVDIGSDCRKYMVQKYGKPDKQNEENMLTEYKFPLYSFKGEIGISDETFFIEITRI